MHGRLFWLQIPNSDICFIYCQMLHKVAVDVVIWQAVFPVQVLVQGCQLERTDLDEFLHHIYQQLRAVESNIAEVLHQQHEQASVYGHIFMLWWGKTQKLVKLLMKQQMSLKQTLALLFQK